MILVEEVEVNGRWPLLLPKHRADRPSWPWWEATRLAAMHATIQPGDLIYDVGAEEGDFPALWSSWGASVVLFEPNCRVWPNIAAIFEANRLPDPVSCFVGFAADTETDPVTVGVGWPDCAEGEVIGDHGFENLAERVDRPCIRIDTMSRLVGPPDVITIDCEGSELRVLVGAERTLCSHHPILFVSVHDDFMADMYGDSRTDLVSFLESCDYEYRHLSTDHESHFVAWHPERPFRCI